MLTRCPQCETLFPLGSEELSKDKGRVRCSRCRSVFYALEHLYQQDETPAVPGAPPELREQLRLGPGQLVPREDLAAGPSQELPLRLQARARPARGLFWPLLVVLLTLGVVGQWAWLERYWLMQQPQLRPLLDLVCQQLPCQWSGPRDIERIAVLERRLQRVEGEPEALVFEITLVNRAPFPQPYPMLELELFANDPQPLGRRVFTPAEYLDGASADALLPPQRRQSLKLYIHEPRSEVSGFEFRFL